MAPRRSARWAFAGPLATMGLPVAFSLLVLLAWEFVVRAAKVPAAILPPPTAVFEQIATHYTLILKHAVPTTLETLLAFGLSIPLGVFLAAVMTWSPVINKAMYPNVIFFQLIPKIALAPLFIVWLGIGLPSRTTFSIFISFFPILVATAAGLQSVPRDMLRLCRSVGASDWQVLTHVRFPTALPFLFSGMKVAVTLSIIGIVVGEFIASQRGLGYLILFASSRLQTDLCLACIAVLCAVGLGLYGLVVLTERLAMRWFGDR
ncbi:MAG TPA: ABC transporter permease [Casimicrobiaceae bacterium]|nr:ABC transporter permease [Casimicrobiaceae bacterium]